MSDLVERNHPDGVVYFNGNEQGDLTVRASEDGPIVVQVQLSPSEWLDLLRSGQVKNVVLTLDGARGYGGTDAVGTVNLSAPWSATDGRWQLHVMTHGRSGCEIDVWVHDEALALAIVGQRDNAAAQVRDRRW